jgi:amino-acid N-acetyltransferase
MVRIRPAAAADLPAIRSLLEESGLPDDDFGETIAFLVAEEDGEIVGTIGLEVYARSGLLRSAAVRPGLRGRGLGGRLVDAVVRGARSRHLDEIVLLTSTAEMFFRRNGFTAVDRGALDGPVLTSGQFAGSRCSAAVVMRMALP